MFLLTSPLTAARLLLKSSAAALLLLQADHRARGLPGSCRGAREKTSAVTTCMLFVRCAVRSVTAVCTH